MNHPTVILTIAALALSGCSPKETPIIEGDVRYVEIRSRTKSSPELWVAYEDKGYIRVYRDYVIYSHPEGIELVSVREDVREMQIKSKRK